MPFKPRISKILDNVGDPVSTILSTPLTGFVVGANTPITSSNTILTALEVVQGQLNAISASEVTSVSGTSNRITTSPITGNVVVDIAATYVGQTSITTLGTIGTGTWQGSLITGQYGGTGINNTGKTITLGGNLTTSGAFTTTLTVTGNTNITLPTSGTLVGGTGVSGQVSYWSGTNSQSGNTGLVYDPVNLLLGIGGTTPAARLHLSGNISAAAWTTNGIGIRSDAATYTDTTSNTTIAAQYIHSIASPTITASSATIYTLSSTVFIGAPLTGTNVTQTTAAALVLSGQLLITAGATGRMGTFDNNALSLVTGNGTRLNIGSSGIQTHTQNALSSGAIPFITYTQAANTGGSAGGLLWTAGTLTAQTASTEVVDQNWANTGTITYLTGALATQRAVRFQGRNYSFGGASTITDLINVDVESPTIGTNGIATNIYAARFQGDLTFTGGNRKFNFSNGLTVSTTSGSPFNITQGGINRYQVTTGGSHIFTGFNSTSGVNTILTITAPSYTTQTLSTEVNDVLVDLSANKQWATGNITTQRDFRILARTYSFVGASTVTTAATLSISGAPIAGTNATLTSAYALNIESGISNFGGNIAVSGNANFSGNTRTIGTSDSNIFNIASNGTTRVSYGTIGTQTHTMTASSSTNTMVTITTPVHTGGSQTILNIVGGAYTTLTASAESIDVNYSLNRTVQWATGALTTQRAVVIQSPTYAFVGASTITTAASLDVTAPTAGTNATITNNFAIRSNGSLCLAVAGNGLLIKEGTNATMGVATLSAGTIVVSTNKVTANSRIYVSVNGGTVTNVGAPYISARTAGTSFTISSTNVIDSSNVAWVIIEPAP